MSKPKKQSEPVYVVESFYTIEKVKQSLYQLIHVSIDSDGNINKSLIKEDIPAIILGYYQQELIKAPFKEQK